MAIYSVYQAVWVTHHSTGFDLFYQLDYLVTLQVNTEHNTCKYHEIVRLCLLNFVKGMQRRKATHLHVQGKEPLRQYNLYKRIKRM